MDPKTEPKPLSSSTTAPPHNPITGEVFASGMQSSSIAYLAEALATAQGEFHAAEKDRQANVKSDKGNYSYKYANFASLMDAVRGPLAKAKLAVTCRVRTDAKGATAVAILMHASGEWMCGDPIFVGVGANTPQATGSAIEYARKYAIRTLLNIATDEEDDDGQAASARPSYGPEQGQRTAPRTQSGRATAPAAGSQPSDTEMELVVIKEHIDAAESVKDLAALVDRIKKLPTEAQANIRKVWGARRDALNAATNNAIAAMPGVSA